MKNILKKVIKYSVLLVLTLTFFYCVAIFLIRPSNDRDWNLDQAILPEISIDSNQIIINNIRDFEYRSTTDYDPRYYSASYPRGSVDSAWFVVEPFAQPGAAHTFLSFGFEDGRYLSISVEIRKEKREKFSPIKGLFRQYELMYVIADEKDVIELRANHRKDNVYLYPAKTSKEKANQLFENMLARAQRLQQDPEFYNTLTNTCTTNIVDHVNKVAEKKISFDKSILFPASSDLYAYDLGLIDTDLPKEKIREKFKINHLSEIYQNHPDYSKLIRGY